MVDVECLSILKKVGDEYNVAVEDFADRLHLYTSGFFLVSALVVSVKQYVFSSMSCYIPVQPKEGAFADYLSNYCWVHGTIPLRSGESMPSSQEEWDLYDKYRRISKSISDRFYLI
ncbi:Innexin [Fasciolopsis buskii]|uniref:Innexin n=1 Tax=Fasciolopsis buskii TaxID=27845 RepID=A0A8E0RTN9_9TREM|nr:Innexin [Fasciolopsis buski]